MVAGKNILSTIESVGIILFMVRMLWLLQSDVSVTFLFHLKIVKLFSFRS